MPDMAIYRHEVRIDDQWHDFVLTGPIVHVAQRHSAEYSEYVEFWAVHDEMLPTTIVSLRVFGTGHSIDRPERPLRYVGTAIAAGGYLVWHLLSRSPVPMQSAALAVSRG